MEKLYFITSGELIALNIKGEFQKAACRHEFRKGKIASEEDLRKRKRPGKDVSLCIKCGMKKGEAEAYGYKSISNEAVRTRREERGRKGNSNSSNREERRRNSKAAPRTSKTKTGSIKD